jgi:enoyl-CoA hydratase/carnithine racemase
VADLLDIRVPSGVASVIFSRPPANALDADAMQQFTPRFCELAERDGVRVVVLAGDGRTFCAGVDRGASTRPARRSAIARVPVHSPRVPRGHTRILQVPGVLRD